MRCRVTPAASCQLCSPSLCCHIIITQIIKLSGPAGCGYAAACCGTHSLPACWSLWNPLWLYPLNRRRHSQETPQNSPHSLQSFSLKRHAWQKATVPPSLGRIIPYNLRTSTLHHTQFAGMGLPSSHTHTHTLRIFSSAIHQ